jgi:hypothetical protein
MRQYPVRHYIIGLDLGRDQDRSAIAGMALRDFADGPFDLANFRQPTRPGLELNLLRRLPFRMPFLHVARHVEELVEDVSRRPIWGPRGPSVHLVLDASGPGQVVHELLTRRPFPATVVPVVITSGLDPGQTNGGTKTVPRRILVSTFRHLLETQVIRVHPDLPHGSILENEAAAVRPHGGQSAHDDLVIAATLTGWQATRIDTGLKYACVT